MIGPVFLRAALIQEFIDHLIKFPYASVIRRGISDLDAVPKTFTQEEAEAVVHDFAKQRFPIICRAGSKSSIPFFDFHVALEHAGNESEVRIVEMLVCEPVRENAAKGMMMAYYTLVNDKTGIEKLWVPFIPEGLDEGLNIEPMGEVKK
ncbi:hypothetical protein [Paenibacillus sanfengchensis]|uniref:hypothetical protein n=1 Tax=Paenibacillus sanfengchensis TaxID=3119819 RepID=UPI002FDFCD42